MGQKIYICTLLIFYFLHTALFVLNGVNYSEEQFYKFWTFYISKEKFELLLNIKIE